MNKQEIDKMMKDLPSQREESLTSKVVVATIFLAIMLLCAWVPDFVPDCIDNQEKQINCEPITKR